MTTRKTMLGWGIEVPCQPYRILMGPAARVPSLIRDQMERKNHAA